MIIIIIYGSKARVIQEKKVNVTVTNKYLFLQTLFLKAHTFLFFSIIYHFLSPLSGRRSGLCILCTVSINNCILYYGYIGVSRKIYLYWMVEVGGKNDLENENKFPNHHSLTNSLFSITNIKNQQTQIFKLKGTYCHFSLCAV